MRTKDEILQAYNLFNEPGRNLTKLRKFTDSIRLEVLLDIRDIIREGLDDINRAIRGTSQNN